MNESGEFNSQVLKYLGTDNPLRKLHDQRSFNEVDGTNGIELLGGEKGVRFLYICIFDDLCNRECEPCI